MNGDLHIYCGNEQLADGSPFVNEVAGGIGVVETLLVDGQKAAAIVPLIDADSPTIFDRCTLTKTVTIRIGREHADADAATTFYLTHDEGLETVADLTIELPGEDVTVTWTATGCGWLSVTQEPTGIFTVTEYVVTLGSRIARTSTDGTTNNTVEGGTYATSYEYQQVADGGDYGDLPEPASAGYIDGGSY